MRNINYTSLANVIFPFPNSSEQEKMISSSFLDWGKYCPILFPKMNRQWTTYPYYLDRDTAGNCSHLGLQTRYILRSSSTYQYLLLYPWFPWEETRSEIRKPLAWQVMAEISKVMSIQHEHLLALFSAIAKLLIQLLYATSIEKLRYIILTYAVYWNTIPQVHSFLVWITGIRDWGSCVPPFQNQHAGPRAGFLLKFCIVMNCEGYFL